MRVDRRPQPFPDFTRFPRIPGTDRIRGQSRDFTPLAAWNIYGTFRTTGVYGVQWGTSTAEITAELYRLSAPTTLVATLSNSKARSWQELLSEPGSGSIVLMADDAALSSIEGDGNDLILFKYAGWAAFMMILEAYEDVEIAEGEEGSEQVNWSGRGHLALLERGLVYPTGGVGKQPVEEDRTFNWSSPSFDDSGWGLAHTVSTVLNAQSNWPNVLAGDGTFADGFTDTDAAVLWASDGTNITAATGHCYFRQEFTVSTAGTYEIHFVVDNYGELYVDGQLIAQAGIGTNDGFSSTTSARLELSIGTHLVAVHGYNAALPPSNVNDPGGVAWAIYPAAASGVVGASISHSDASCRMVEYQDEPPGMPVGRVMRICLEEMQARSVLTGLTWTFTDNADSAGEAWPVSADIATKTGTDILTFFRELSGTYVDLWMAPGGLVLHAWNKDGRGDTKSVTLKAPTNPLNPATGNLTSLTRRGET